MVRHRLTRTNRPTALGDTQRSPPDGMSPTCGPCLVAFAGAGAHGGPNVLKNATKGPACRPPASLPSPGLLDHEQRPHQLSETRAGQRDELS